MRSTRSKSIIKRIAEKENLSIKQVEDIVYSFFRFTSKRMKEGDRTTHEFKSIRLFKFGVFKVKNGRRIQLKIANEKSDYNNKRTANNLTRGINDQGVQEDLDS